MENAPLRVLLCQGYKFRSLPVHIFFVLYRSLLFIFVLYFCAVEEKETQSDQQQEPKSIIYEYSTQCNHYSIETYLHTTALNSYI